ncbi:hypothetical protein J2S09_001722 [Bacillus fengqiuensis]|nr:hypothetical protein [Bacillus fengqiuensis]
MPGQVAGAYMPGMENKPFMKGPCCR